MRKPVAQAKLRLIYLLQENRIAPSQVLTLSQYREIMGGYVWGLRAGQVNFKVSFGRWGTGGNWTEVMTHSLRLLSKAGQDLDIHTISSDI